MECRAEGLNITVAEVVATDDDEVGFCSGGGVRVVGYRQQKSHCEQGGR